jgi:hypothetical protein
MYRIPNGRLSSTSFLVVNLYRSQISCTDVEGSSGDEGKRLALPLLSSDGCDNVFGDAVEGGGDRETVPQTEARSSLFLGVQTLMFAQLNPSLAWLRGNAVQSIQDIICRMAVIEMRDVRQIFVNNISL